MCYVEHSWINTQQDAPYKCSNLICNDVNNLFKIIMAYLLFTNEAWFCLIYVSLNINAQNSKTWNPPGVLEAPSRLENKGYNAQFHIAMSTAHLFYGVVIMKSCKNVPSHGCREKHIPFYAKHIYILLPQKLSIYNIIKQAWPNLPQLLASVFSDLFFDVSHAPIRDWSNHYLSLKHKFPKMGHFPSFKMVLLITHLCPNLLQKRTTNFIWLAAAMNHTSWALNQV
jgi:hypothetical protein